MFLVLSPIIFSVAPALSTEIFNSYSAKASAISPDSQPTRP